MSLNVVVDMGTRIKMSDKKKLKQVTEKKNIQNVVTKFKINYFSKYTQKYLNSK